jgi:NAD-dependent SIR2 family protein deacetylase
MPPYDLVVDNNKGRNSLSLLDDVFNGAVNLLAGRKNVIVLVGAGMSTSCGIPDFRSKSNGLYESLDTTALGLSCPEELFCYDFFQHNPRPFYKFAQNLYHPLGPGTKIEPSDSHKLLALLEEKKMLLRVYT